MTSATTDSPIVYHLQQRKSRPHLTRSPTTWQAFAEAMLHEHDERDDKDGLGFVLADFSTPYRLAENVTSYSAVLLDMDTRMGLGGRPETPPSVAYAFEQLQASGLAGLIYTTHNHEAPASVNDGKPAGPRYRVIIPLAAPIAPSALKRVTMAAARRLHLDGPGLDPKSWVIGQFFYHPSCRPGAPRFAASSDGLPLDPAEADQPEPPPEPAPAPAPAAVIRSPRPLSGGSLYDEAKAHARGQWRGILSSLGVTVPDSQRMHSACPGCGGKDRFRFDDKDGHGTFICSQGGGGTLAGDGFDLVQHTRSVDATEALMLVRDALGLERRAPRPPVAQRHEAERIDPDTGEIVGEPAGGEAGGASAVRGGGFNLCSEDDLAMGHIERMEGKTLWCEKWGCWLTWTGSMWKRDETLKVMHEVRVSMRLASAEVFQRDDLKDAQKFKLAERLRSARVISNVEHLARLDRSVASHPDEWDADTWLLNTPAGVVDLRDGRRRDHRRSDRMTKITAVSPGGDCPTWMRFLRTATGGDDELIGFLARMCGYALTGQIREHALFFVYGTGGNGKGTFLNTITHIMGDYQRVAGAETFTESSGDRHTTELARLQGARLVTAQETEEGKRWAEARIKALTGGDPITARFMRQDDFTYIPQFKLVLVGNHKPAFRNVDDAIRRRLHLIPFTATIRPEDRDPLLADKLKAEAPGILAWMIRGCLDWQRHGLNPPDLVRASTEQYLGSEDVLQQWLDECCEIGQGFASSRELFLSWSRWAEDAGEYVGTTKRLVSKLETRGVKTGHKLRGERGCLGIKLRMS